MHFNAVYIVRKHAAWPLIRASSTYVRRCKHVAREANANAAASTNKRAAVRAGEGGAVKMAPAQWKRKLQ